jgi:Na+/phosphate symporter
MQAISDLTAMTDQGLQLADHAKRLHRTYDSFSKKAAAELELTASAMAALLEQTFPALSEQERVPVESDRNSFVDVRTLTEEYLNHNRKRMQKGKCTQAAGVALADVLRDYDGIAERCHRLMDPESLFF